MTFYFLFTRCFYVKLAIVKELNTRKIHACGCVFKRRVSKKCMNFRIWKYLPVNVSMCNNSFCYFRDQQQQSINSNAHAFISLKISWFGRCNCDQELFHVANIVVNAYERNTITTVKTMKKHTQPVFYYFIYLFKYPLTFQTSLIKVKRHNSNWNARKIL